MKKLTNLIISSVMVFSLAFINLNNIYASEKNILSYTANEISQMDDQEYLTLLNNYYFEAKEQGLTLDKIRSQLKTVGIEFDEGNQIQSRISSSLSSDISLKIHTSRRSGQAYTYVTATATAQKNLWKTSTEDAMSIEWEPSKGSYYGYSETKNTTLKDYSKRQKGILVFNVQDKKMPSKGQYAQASVKVIFKNNNSRGDAGIKYIHTYSENAPSLSFGANLGYGGKNVAGGLSFKATFTSTDRVWERAYIDSL